MFNHVVRLFDALDQVGVVAAVAELHVDVEEGGAGPRVGAAQQQRSVLVEDGAVARLLEVGDLHTRRGGRQGQGQGVGEGLAFTRYCHHQ